MVLVYTLIYKEFPIQAPDHMVAALYLNQIPHNFLFGNGGYPARLTLNHAIARCTQTISYPAAQIQQDNGH